MKNKDVIPFLISFFLTIWSFIRVVSTNTMLNQRFYIGLACLLLSTLLYFVHKKAYIITFGLTLIASLIGFLDFFYITFKIGFAGVGVNPIFIVLLVFYVVFGKDTMNRLFPEKSNIH